MTSAGPDARRGVAAWSLGVAVAVFVLKLTAWAITGSTAVLSDALESIVNIAAAGFLVFSARFASEPADREHPYGHGKIEHVSAAFEGGLVTVAGFVIVVGAGVAWWTGPELQSIDVGLAVTTAAGLVNLGLGAWLVRQGRHLGSPALVADGHHVLSDVWTTGGVLLGLGLVAATGWTWLDPLAALGVGALLLATGARLVRSAVGGLLDQEDPELVKRLRAAFEVARLPGMIDLHDIRTIGAGGDVHVDAHAHVPEHWTVLEAHAAVEALERDLLRAADLRGDLAIHLDPCLRAFCSRCDASPCAARAEPFAGR